MPLSTESTGVGKWLLGDPGKFYEASVDAVGRLGVRAVLLDGRGGDGTRVTPDILSVSYAPHSYLFPRASVIVHSGGIGTCAWAMRAGRPMLVVPFAYDQPDNALRLARLGVARTVGNKSYTARRAATEIALLLKESRYRTNAERISRIVESENGAVAACDALENCLAGVPKRMRRFQLYESTPFPVLWAEKVARVLEECRRDEIADIGSGSGGPIKLVMGAMAKVGCQPRVTLTDLYPVRTMSGMDYCPQPINATCVPAELRGLRTLFAAFHHFAPAARRQY